jgi:hypothetical protein
MIFPYLSVRRRNTIRSLPIIPVQLCGPIQNVSVLALLDSGAEYSVFNRKLLDMLGLTIDNATLVEIIGVGGSASQGVLLDVEHRLGRHRWRGPAVFSDTVDSPMILGQAGFFEFFNITFKRRQSLMDIRRAR